MKKLITVLCISAIALTIGSTAMATDTESEKPIKTRIAERMEMREKGPKGPEGVEMREKGPRDPKDLNLPEEIKEKLGEAKEENAEIMKENMELRQDLREIMKEHRENEDEFSAEIRDSLKNYHEEIKGIHEEMMESRGAIKALIDSNLEAIKAGDENVIESVFEEISEIQETRMNNLESINDLLKEMIKLVK